jgi:tetratricopeptide (TPR) repeat protein
MNRSLLVSLFLFAISQLPPAAMLAQTPSPLDEARAALKTNDLAKAAALLGPLTGADAKEAAAFHLLSQVKLAEKKTSEAVTLAERATVLDGTKPAHFVQLGWALGQRMGEVGFMQQAMMAGKLKGAFVKAVELDPNDVQALIGLGRFYSNAPEIAGGSIEKAREYARRVQRLDPFLGEVELGNLAAQEEKFADALKHFEAAATMKPGHAHVQAHCGRMLAKLGRNDEARARFEAALKIAPALEIAKKGLAGLAPPAP